MARITAGIAVSHAPTIDFGYGTGKQEDPVWKPIFDSFIPLRDYFAHSRPRATVYIFNDHVSSSGFMGVHF